MAPDNQTGSRACDPILFLMKDNAPFGQRDILINRLAFLRVAGMTQSTFVRVHCCNLVHYVYCGT